MHRRERPGQRGHAPLAHTDHLQQDRCTGKNVFNIKYKHQTSTSVQLQDLKSEAQTKRFFLDTSLCVPSAAQADSTCVDTGTVITTTIKGEFFPPTIMAALIGNAQLIAGVAIGVIVIILTSVIFHKCNVFQKVRFFHPDQTAEEGAPDLDEGEGTLQEDLPSLTNSEIDKVPMRSDVD